MAKAAQTQLYLTLEPGGAGDLAALLRDARPACVRLRIENASDTDVARTCRELCHAQDVPLLIAGPDEAAIVVARAIGADGVHLEGAPKAAPWARRELGETVIVGIDAGDADGTARHEAMVAAETGADYVSLSPDWTSEDAAPEEARWWAAMIETPMVIENAGTAARARVLRGVADFVVAEAGEAVAVAKALGKG